MFKKMAFALLIVILFGLAQNVLAGDSKVAVSPDGQSSIEVDGNVLHVNYHGVEFNVIEPNVYHVEFLDNQSAMVYRADYAVFVLNVYNRGWYHIGWNFPDHHCSPCNIGGEG